MSTALQALGNRYTVNMEYKFTDYFERQVLRKRPYLKKEWCIRVLQSPLKSEPQEHNRFRFWGIIDEYEGRILRVVTPGGQGYDTQCIPRQEIQA
jgi:hypothetical protein